MKRLKLISSAEAQPFRVQHKAPCSDCPWARKSLKGWTGPNTVGQWLAVARDYWHVIACHTRRIAVGVRHPLSKELDGHWQCAGAAIFRANTGVKPFPTRRLLQLPADTAKVFATRAEFEAHHGKVSEDEAFILDLKEGGRHGR